MMKKVLYGVALTLLASASVGSLQSCKDDVNDLKTQTSYDLYNLENLFNQKLKDLQDQINGKQDEGEYALLSDLDNYAKLKYLHQLIFGTDDKTLTDEDKEELADIIAKGGLYAMINGAGSTCDCEHYQEIYDLLFPQGIKQPADYGDSTDMIAYLNGKIGANAASISEILKFLNGYIYDENGNPISGTEGYQNLATLLKGLNDQIFALANEDETKGPLGRVTLLEKDVDALKTDVATIKQQLKDLTEEVQKIENTFLQAINDRIDNLITSIKVERAISPVFGDFSAPMGIKSNILFNWYGLSDQSIAYNFPSTEKGVSANGDPAFTLPAGVTPIPIPAGFLEDEVELGNVYVTLNPIGHQFNGTELTFTTSAGKQLDFKVSLDEENEYELMHGVNNTRAEITGNGFYKGKVTVPSAQIESIKLSIDEKLMTAMKNAVKDQSKRNAASLIKAIYDQMSDIMPAYALRYDWTSQYYNGNATSSTDDKGNVTYKWDSEVSNKAYAVLSGYDLGVAAARPLGFNFLRGEGASSDKIPTIGNIDNFIQEMIDRALDKIDIKGKDMEVLDHKIGFADGSVKIVTENGKLVAYISGVTVDGKVLGQPYTVDGVAIKAVKTVAYEAPEETTDYINKALSLAIADEISSDKDQTSQVYKEVQAKVEACVDIALLQMQKQVNEVLESINGQITEAFNSVGSSAESYINKANRAIDLYNKVAKKINNILKNPNHYLQAAAFYVAGNNMGILSSNPNSPTVFKGSGNAISLYLSTYTGEIIAPAYKKYIAVTTPGAESLNTGDLNTVLDGSKIKVEVNVANFESNKVYELTYQAVDYRGFTSTRKCYIKVVK